MIADQFALNKKKKYNSKLTDMVVLNLITNSLVESFDFKPSNKQMAARAVDCFCCLEIFEGSPFPNASTIKSTMQLTIFIRTLSSNTLVSRFNKSSDLFCRRKKLSNILKGIIGKNYMFPPKPLSMLLIFGLTGIVITETFPCSELLI